MNFEFRAAQEKFEKEHRERVRKAKAEAERKRKLQEETRARQLALEERQRVRRVEEATLQEEAREREAAELESSDGTLFKKNFQIVPISGEGDKIMLPDSSFSDLMSQNAIDKGPMYFELKLNSLNTTTSIKEPPSESNSKTDSETQTQTHAGVLEFTAAEGCVGLPSHILNCLNPFPSNDSFDPDQLSGSSVSVRYVRLPKGKYAKLQPLQFNFFRIPNHKSMLETKLRAHTTLTVGDVLTIPYAEQTYSVKVVQLKPENAVSVIDTDIEVDIEPPPQNLGFKDRDVLSLELGKKEEGTVDDKQYHYFKILIPEKHRIGMREGELKLVIRLDVLESSEINDADLYVTRHPVMLPSLLFHQWSSNGVGSKVLTVTEIEKPRPGPNLSPNPSSNPNPNEMTNLDSLIYTVGVYGFRGRSNYAISSTVLETHNLESVQKVGASSESLQSDRTSLGLDLTKRLCGNCGQFVPANSFLLHEAYCLRHNAKCNYEGCLTVLKRDDMSLHVHCVECGVPMWKSELQKHMQVAHTFLKCPCGISLQMREMCEHSSKDCPVRIINCRFCGDYVPANGNSTDARDRLHGLTQHESTCGSRTTSCHVCSRVVRMKDMDMHIRAVHSTQPQARDLVKSFASSQASDSLSGANILSDGGGSVDDFSNRVGSGLQKTMNVSCPICGACVHSERDLSVHMDVVH